MADWDPTPAPANSLPVVLTVDEVAALLRVDRKSVYSMIRRGKLPGVRRVNRAIRIGRDAVIRWLGADDA
jgi:excisionase family DNA binding protein